MKYIFSILLFLFLFKRFFQFQQFLPPTCIESKEELFLKLKHLKIQVYPERSDGTYYKYHGKLYKHVKFNVKHYPGEFEKKYGYIFQTGEDFYPEDNYTKFQMDAFSLEKNRKLSTRLYKLTNCWFYAIGDSYEEKSYEEYLIETDYIEETLEDLFKRKDPIMKVLFWQYHIMFKIALAIKEYSDNGFIHGDIHSLNFLMRNKYLPTLANFSTCELIENNFFKKTKIILRLPFTAPEIRNQKIFDVQSDIYSLAGIFFKILTYDEIPLQDSENEEEYIDFTTKPNYSPIYKYFEKLLFKMTLESRFSRFNINQVLDYLLKKLPRVINYIRNPGFDDTNKPENFCENYKDPVYVITDEQNMMKKSYLAENHNFSIEFNYNQIWEDSFIISRFYKDYSIDRFDEKDFLINARQYQDVKSHGDLSF